jgi:hypothetical protein
MFDVRYDQCSMCSMFDVIDVRCSMFDVIDVRCSMFDVIDVRCDRCSIVRPFRVVNEEA